MTKDFFDVVNERTSIREYDSSAKLSKEELTELLEATVKSPSAWNFTALAFRCYYRPRCERTSTSNCL